MHGTTYSTLIVAALMAVGGSCDAAEPGSRDAAKDMVPEFLGRLYTVVETPVLDGKKAVVKAKMANLNCTLVLAPHPTANRSGWVVERVDCKQ